MRVVPVVAAVVLLAGCSDTPAPAAAPTSDRASAPVVTSPAADTVTGVLAGVELRLEVADDPRERAVGLMGRTSVPAGTGMVFLYDALSEGRFYMYRVPVPLRATFVRDGRVVSTVVMPPCRVDDRSVCPTYGADGPYDTVVETSPDVAPSPAPGDPFSLRD